MRFGREKILHIFLILAFVLAQISPACAFVSGKSGLIEICAADGSLKTIAVDAKYAQSSQTSSPEKHKAHDRADDCGFCFAQAHIKKLSAQQQDALPLISRTSVLRTGAGSIVYKSVDTDFFQARAPPSVS